MYLDNYTTINEWDFTLTTGFNRLYIPQKQYVSKGSLIYLDLSSYTAILNIDTNGDALYTDLKITNSNLDPINNYTNQQFYFTCVIEGQFYYSTTPISFLYKKFNTYNLTAKIITSTLPDQKIKRELIVSNCKLFLILN